MYEHVLALEDEAAGLRAQLKRFSRRVSATVDAGSADSLARIIALDANSFGKSIPLDANSLGKLED